MGSGSSGTETDTDDTLRSYGSDIGARTSAGGRIREWILVDGDRLLMAVGLSVGVFVLLLALNAADVVGFVNSNSMTRVASGMIAGTLSLVTLVVSINQLILSRDFVAAGEFRNRLGGVMEYRRDVEDETPVATAPASPTGLVEALVEEVDRRAEALDAAVADHDESVRRPVTRFTNDIDESTDRLEDTIESADFGTFDAVTAMIRYDESWQIYAARRLETMYEADLSDDAREAVDDLIDVLKLFAVAREQFKTTYLQRELTRFSQLTIYLGVPSVLSAVLLGVLYAEYDGAAIGLEYLPVVASGLVAVVLAPLGLLVAFILRTATVTRRTASIGPMIPQKRPEEGPFDVDTVEGDDAD